MINNFQNKEEFLNNYNIDMIWDIILDEKLITINNKEDIHKNKLYFINKIHIFYEREKSSNKNLIQMNKDFIDTIINSEKKSRPLEVMKEPTKNFIKAEDMKLDRMTQFGKEVEKQKENFANSVQKFIPDAPNFKDNSEDTPIANMEELINKTMAQRNFDIEQINEKVNIEDVHKFLKGSETSLKSEKIHFKENVTTTLNKYAQQKPIEREIKYIKISSEDLNTKPDIIELTISEPIDEVKNPKKHIQWAEKIDDEGIKNTSISEPNNIFSKLKMKAGSLSPLEKNILLTKTNLKKPGEESDFYKQEKYDRLVNKVDLLAQKVDMLIECILRDKNEVVNEE